VDPSSFPGEEKVFIGSPWSKHVPNGRQNDIRGGFLEAKWSPGMAFGVFGGSWVSIAPPGGFPEGLLVDLGSPLRSSVGPWVVFEGQLDTLFRFKVPLACFWEIDVPRTREAHFRGRALQSGWQNPSRSNLRDGVGFCSIGKKLAPIQRLLRERLWHPGGWPRPRK